MLWRVPNLITSKSYANCNTFYCDTELERTSVRVYVYTKRNFLLFLTLLFLPSALLFRFSVLSSLYHSSTSYLLLFSTCYSLLLHIFLSLFVRGPCRKICTEIWESVLGVHASNIHRLSVPGLTTHVSFLWPSEHVTMKHTSYILLFVMVVTVTSILKHFQVWCFSSFSVIN